MPDQLYAQSPPPDPCAALQDSMVEFGIATSGLAAIAAYQAGLCGATLLTLCEPFVLASIAATAAAATYYYYTYRYERCRESNPLCADFAMNPSCGTGAGGGGGGSGSITCEWLHTSWYEDGIWYTKDFLLRI